MLPMFVSNINFLCGTIPLVHPKPSKTLCCPNFKTLEPSNHCHHHCATASPHYTTTCPMRRSPLGNDTLCPLFGPLSFAPHSLESWCCHCTTTCPPPHRCRLIAMAPCSGSFSLFASCFVFLLFLCSSSGSMRHKKWIGFVHYWFYYLLCPWLVLVICYWF